MRQLSRRKDAGHDNFIMEVSYMAYIPVEDLLDKIESRYKLVVLASRRAEELNSGGQRLVDMSPKEKVSNVALEEIRTGMIAYKESEKDK